MQLDDAEKARVQAHFHSLSLNWGAAEKARVRDTEPPMERVNRLAAESRATPMVASDELLKILGRPPRREAS